MELDDVQKYRNTVLEKNDQHAFTPQMAKSKPTSTKKRDVQRATLGFTLKQTLNEGIFAGKTSQRELNRENLKAPKKNFISSAAHGSLVKQAPTRAMATKSPNNLKINQNTKKQHGLAF